MNSIRKYIFFSILKTYGLCGLVFYGIFSSLYLVKFLDFALRYNADMMSAVYFVFLSTPYIISSSVIMSLFIAIYIKISGMTEANEIISIKAMGYTEKDIYKPIFLSGVAVAVFCFVLNFVDILSQNSIKIQKSKIVSFSAVNSFKKNQINNIGDYEVIFNDVDSAKKMVNLHVVKKDKNKVDSFLCEKGILKENSGSLLLEGESCVYSIFKDEKLVESHKAKFTKIPIKFDFRYDYFSMYILFKKIISGNIDSEVASFVNSKITFIYCIVLAFFMGQVLSEKTNTRCNRKVIDASCFVYFFFIMYFYTYLNESMIKGLKVFQFFFLNFILILICFFIKKILKFAYKY